MNNLLELSERLSVTSRKLAVLILELSILNPKNLKALIIFFCILEYFRP